MSCQRFVIIDLSCTITWRILICHEKWSNLTNLFQSLSLQHFNSSFSFFNLFFSFINLYCILTLICHVTVRKHTCNKQTIQIVNIFVSFNRTSKFLRKQIQNTSNPVNTCQLKPCLAAKSQRPASDSKTLIMCGVSQTVFRS